MVSNSLSGSETLPISSRAEAEVRKIMSLETFSELRVIVGGSSTALTVIETVAGEEV